ncbi:MAG: hypothetical protein EPN41_07360 [Candidimonas sp.]|nr:MAG: hypothetical protein EPN41_07360 [Candidimonas sp.]
MDFTALLHGIAELLTLPTLLTMVIGAICGLIAAAIPGFTITMAIILTLPLTFGMPVMQGIATMIAVLVGGYTGGLFSAALLGIPGTPSAVASTFDGFPMARRGEPGRALGIGIWASFGGVIISTIVLVLAAPPLAKIAVKLGPWEYFSLIVFALTVVAGIAGDSLTKGLMTGVLGLLITTVGPDPMLGMPRFTFGTDTLANGIPFLVVLIGVFAVSQLLSETEDAQKIQKGTPLISGKGIRFKPWLGLNDVLHDPVNLIRSSFVGVFIGAVPGAGGSISNLVAYDQAKRYSKTPEKFGTGIPQGIVASESGAAATSGGGLIPMIALGIPGTAVDAVFMAALMVHGIGIGPRLIIEHPATVYGMFVALVVASLITLVLALGTMKFFLRVVGIPMSIIAPVVLVFCLIGAFALTQRVTDMYSLLGVGILGYVMKRLDYPLAPIVLSVVLGPIAETNLRRALMIHNDWTLFFTRPVSLGLLLFALFSVVLTVYQRRRAKARRESVATAA